MTGGGGCKVLVGKCAMHACSQGGGRFLVVWWRKI